MRLVRRVRLMRVFGLAISWSAGAGTSMRVDVVRNEVARRQDSLAFRSGNAVEDAAGQERGHALAAVGSFGDGVGNSTTDRSPTVSTL